MAEPNRSFSGSDPDALEEKYRLERDRRRRVDRTSIHDLRSDDRFGRYRKDPFTPFTERDPVAKDCEVAIVGAGMGGIVVAARLREQGIEDLCLLDEAGGFGGTWYWNRYPGVMCDIESTIYMPMLEEMGKTPSTRYAFGEEIREHFEAIADRYALRPASLFHTRVERTEWNEDGARWEITTDRGDRIRARFVIMAVGMLNLMKLPATPGMERFEGHAFHTARWDYDYTGGGPGDWDELPGLRDKRVALIGTGSSGIQCVPPLAASAEQLYVFQRTPSAIGVRDNRPIPKDFATDLAPGWQAERMDNFAKTMLALPTDEDLIDDGWTRYYAPLLTPRVDYSRPLEEIMRQIAAIDHGVMDAHRDRVDAIVSNREKAEILKPYYRYLCKRPCFHDEYLPAMDLGNVTLVDCPDGVEEITPDGLVANGTKYAVDCIVYATGFEGESTPFQRRAGHPIVGRNGIDMEAKWRDGVRSLHGLMTSGFPNFFTMPNPYQQAVVTVTHTHITVECADHIAKTLGAMHAKGVQAFDVTPEAEEAWTAEIVSKALDRSSFTEGCTPSRFNGEGSAEPANPRNGSYGGSAGDLFGYRALLADWRERGDFEGLEILPTAEDLAASD